MQQEHDFLRQMQLPLVICKPDLGNGRRQYRARCQTKSRRWLLWEPPSPLPRNSYYPAGLRLAVLLVGGAATLLGGCASRPIPRLWTVESATPSASSKALDAPRLIVKVHSEYIYPIPAPLVELELPGAAGQANSSIVAQRIASVSTDHMWQGRLAGDSYSNVTFAQVGEAVVGLITTSSGPMYRLRSYDGAFPIVERLDPRSPGTLDMELETSIRAGCSEARVEKAKIPRCASQNELQEEVRVLVVYTPAAQSWAGGTEEMLAWIAAAEQRTNQSFVQSGVRHRIKVVRRELVPYHESNFGTEHDLRAMNEVENELNKEVGRLRNANSADIAILLVSNGHSPGHACSLTSNDLDSLSAAEAAFGVVAIQFLARDDTFAHELGHILGAGHPDDRDGGATGFGRGYSAPADDKCRPWKTIMDRMGSGEPAPILYWSNPETEGCAKKPMGIPNFADNARTLNRTACTVASYR